VFAVVDRAQWGNLAEWAAVLAAVDIAIVSIIVAGRAAKKADRAQHRATKALEIAAVAQDRLAALAEAEAARYRVPWVLSQVGQSRHRLTNDSDETAHDVVIRGDYLFDDPVSADRVGPRGAVDFFAARTGGANDEDVIVTWRRPAEAGGEEHEWRHQLP
jgi:hypothetical protein